MPILASSGSWAYASLNPFGYWTAGALSFSAVLWLLVEFRLFRSERAHSWVTVAAPFILLAILAYSNTAVGSWLGLTYYWSIRHHFLTAPEYQITNYILIATAVVLAAKAARLRAHDLRIIGFTELALAVIVFGMEAWAIWKHFYAVDWN